MAHRMHDRMLAPMTVLPEKARNSAQTLRVWAACQAEAQAEAEAEAETQVHQHRQKWMRQA